MPTITNKGYGSPVVDMLRGKLTPDGSSAPAPTPTPTPAPTATAPATAPAPAPSRQDILNNAMTEAQRISGVLDGMASEPTIGQDLGTVGYETGPSYKELYPTIDEDRITKNQMRLFQREIDATNRVYDDMLGQERLAGQGRLGSQRAMSARGGLLGSDFGKAQKDNQVGFNQSAERAVENERMAKIGTIMGTMRQSVADEIAAKRAARQQDAQSYIDYLAGARERKANNLNLAANAFLQAGIDPTTMSEEEVAAVGQEAGLSTQDILTAYQQLKSQSEAAGAEADLKTRKTEAEIAKIDADIAKGKLITIGEGTMLYDTETGETFKNPKTYAPSSGGGGGGGSQDEVTDNFSAARSFITDNPDASAEDLKSGLLEYADELGLSVTDINALIDEAGVPKRSEMLVLSPSQVNTIATKVRKAVAKITTHTSQELEAAKEYIRRGEITTGGETYKLSNAQINDILTELDNLGERTFSEAVIPGGG